MKTDLKARRNWLQKALVSELRNQSWVIPLMGTMMYIFLCEHFSSLLSR
jgi:hypothetical protein